MDFDLMFPKIIYNFLKSRPYKRTTLKYKGRRIKLEIADTFAKQMIGLMYRDGIAGDEGMLFPMSFSTRTGASVIMVNMKFDIDLVWLDKEKRVVDVFRNAKPSRSIFGRSYTPEAAARYVIELKSGTVRRLGMKKRDTFNF
jgi:uncharacterized protein